MRQLLASTEALLKDVEAAIAEARRLHEQARVLHGQQPAPPLGYTGGHALPGGLRGSESGPGEGPG